MSKQKQVAAVQEKPVGLLEEAGQEIAPPALPRFQVSLGNHGPTSIHEAADGDGAWEAYKTKHGIIKSEHQPTILQLGQDGKPIKEKLPANDDDLPVEGEPITPEEEAKWANERKNPSAVGVFAGPVQGKPNG